MAEEKVRKLMPLLSNDNMKNKKVTYKNKDTRIIGRPFYLECIRLNQRCRNLKLHIRLP